MAIYEFEGKRPQIGKTSFVPDSADVVGDVVIGEGCFIGVGARIRGDYSATGLRCRKTWSSTPARTIRPPLAPMCNWATDASCTTAPSRTMP
ncbi:MAG: hypothetical protein HZB20_00850 [Chloroflexi bacterium]|nr:hypothetical protein [Chloroflexota bacterium]